MSLEDAIKENTAAVKALTAQLAKGGGSAAAKGAGTNSDKPKVTQEEVLTAMTKLRDDFDVKAAKAVLSKFGAAKTSELKEADYAKALAAAKAKHAELTAAAEESDGGDDDDM